MGTLGAGNHYAEIQVVDEVFDVPAASKMGIDRVGQVGAACKSLDFYQIFCFIQMFKQWLIVCLLKNDPAHAPSHARCA